MTISDYDIMMVEFANDYAEPDCHECFGEGHVDGDDGAWAECQHCHGTGIEPKRRRLEDKIAALEKENAELKAWKVGVVERTIRALMPKKIDPDEAEHIIRDIAAEGEKK